MTTAPISHQPTFDQLATLHDDLAKAAVKAFNENGELLPHLYIGEIDEDGHYKLMQAPSELVLQYFTADSRDQQRNNVAALAARIRSILLPGPARAVMSAVSDAPLPNVVVQVNETWVVASPDGDRSKHPESLADAPTRREAILIQLHTSRGTYAGYSHIQDSPRRAELGTLCTTKIEGACAMPDTERVVH